MRLKCTLIEQLNKVNFVSVKHQLTEYPHGGVWTFITRLFRYNAKRYKMNKPLILWLAYKVEIFSSTTWVVKLNLTVIVLKWL